MEFDNKLYKVYFENPKKISITTDPGDILDISYLAKRVKNKKYNTGKKIIAALRKNNIMFSDYNGVLCFPSEAYANKAIEILNKET